MPCRPAQVVHVVSPNHQNNAKPDSLNGNVPETTGYLKEAYRQLLVAFVSLVPGLRLGRK